MKDILAKVKEVQDVVEYKNFIDIKRLNFIVDHIDFQVNEVKNFKILDVGCGNGNISLFLGHLGFDVFGIDISEEAIKSANAKNHFANVKFKAISAEKVQDLEHEKFNVIICSEVLEHLHDPRSLIQILDKRLKRNGRLIITVPNGHGPREVLITKPVQSIEANRSPSRKKLLLSAKKLLGYSGKTIQSNAADLTHVQFFSFKSLNALLGSHDFELLDSESADFLSNVFPFSLLTKRSFLLQQGDSSIADLLPITWASGFHTVWGKRNGSN